MLNDNMKNNNKTLNSNGTTNFNSNINKYQKVSENQNNTKELYQYFVQKYKKEDEITLNMRKQIINEKDENILPYLTEKVKTLENWEKQNIRVDQSMYNMFKKEKDISNIYGEIKKDIQNLKKFNIPMLADFSKKVDYEKESIMLQNIKISKRKFVWLFRFEIKRS